VLQIKNISVGAEMAKRKEIVHLSVRKTGIEESVPLSNLINKQK